MRKIILKILTTLFIVSLLFTNLSGFSKVKAISSESKIVNVSVDPRIELLSAVQLLSDYPLLTRSDFQYKREMLNYFSPYKSHPAVTKFKEMSEEGFAYDAPPTAMLYLSDPPELKVVTPFTDYIIGRAGGRVDLESFIEALRDFAIKSNFMEFFNAHKDFYAILIQGTKANLDDYDIVGALEDFYGISKNSYNIITSPLQSNAYGPSIEREPSKYDIYSIMPGFQLWVVLHEFGHSFVNPITAKYRDEVNKYSKLFEPVKEIMIKNAHGEWEICVNEHIIQAVVAKVLEKLVGQQVLADVILSDTVEGGYVYVRGIYELLNVYENNRDKYPTFEDFYPEILNYFSEISKLPSLPMEMDFNFLPTEFTEKKVELTWRDTSDDEEGFKVYRKAIDDEEFKLIGTLKENTEHFEDTTIQPGKTCSYRVSSFNENGENFAPEDVTVRVPVIVVVFQIGNKIMYVNDIPQEIDVLPQIIEGRTYLPVRWIAEPLGATVDWDGYEKKVTVKLKETVIELWIDKNIAIVNGANTLIDLGNPKVVPVIIPPGRTMLPIRFIAENLGCKVDWDPALKEVKITYPGS